MKVSIEIKNLSMLPPFPLVFAMKWWSQVPWGQRVRRQLGWRSWVSSPGMLTQWWGGLCPQLWKRLEGRGSLVPPLAPPRALGQDLSWGDFLGSAARRGHLRSQSRRPEGGASPETRSQERRLPDRGSQSLQLLAGCTRQESRGGSCPLFPQ